MTPDLSSSASGQRVIFPGATQWGRMIQQRDWEARCTPQEVVGNAFGKWISNRLAEMWPVCTT
jgi:hypothetical protein